MCDPKKKIYKLSHIELCAQDEIFVHKAKNRIHRCQVLDPESYFEEVTSVANKILVLEY